MKLLFYFVHVSANKEHVSMWHYRKKAFNDVGVKLQVLNETCLSLDVNFSKHTCLCFPMNYQNYVTIQFKGKNESEQYKILLRLSWYDDSNVHTVFHPLMILDHTSYMWIKYIVRAGFPLRRACSSQLSCFYYCDLFIHYFN